MKLWSKEALLLGGMYGILEAPFTYLKCEFITDILFFIFICCAIMLCFNRTPKFISKTIENYPNISYYLVSIGWIPYFVISGLILFILSGFIIDYSESFLELVFKYLYYILPLLIFASLIIAFIKKRKNPKL